MAIKFEIEGIVHLEKRGTLVLARSLDANARFRVTEGSTLGGVPLTKHLDIPRATDHQGKQRMDVFGFALAQGESGAALTSGTIVELYPGDRLELLEPWFAHDDDSPEEQLRLEAAPAHPLYNAEVKCIAIRGGSDDVLFELSGMEHRYATVHFAFPSRPDESGKYPSTEFYLNWWDVYEEVIFPDNEPWRR